MPEPRHARVPQARGAAAPRAGGAAPRPRPPPNIVLRYTKQFSTAIT